MEGFGLVAGKVKTLVLQSRFMPFGLVGEPYDRTAATHARPSWFRVWCKDRMEMEGSEATSIWKIGSSASCGRLSAQQVTD